MGIFEPYQYLDVYVVGLQTTRTQVIDPARIEYEAFAANPKATRGQLIFRQNYL